MRTAWPWVAAQHLTQKSDFCGVRVRDRDVIRGETIEMNDAKVGKSWHQQPRQPRQGGLIVQGRAEQLTCLAKKLQVGLTRAQLFFTRTNILIRRACHSEVEINR